MADAKITSLPRASIVSSDLFPVATVATSVTGALTYIDFKNTLMAQPTINQGTVVSPSITGNAIFTLPMSVMGIGVSSVTGFNKLVLDTAATLVSPSITTGVFTNPSIVGSGAIAANVTFGSILGGNQKLSGLGYVTGAGSVVTQATSKETAIVMNAATGKIILNASLQAASVITSFLCRNSAIGVSDILLMGHVSGGTLGAYTFAQSTLGGTINLIKIRNNMNAPLSEAVVIGFAVIKSDIA